VIIIIIITIHAKLFCLISIGSQFNERIASPVAFHTFIYTVSYLYFVFSSGMVNKYDDDDETATLTYKVVTLNQPLCHSSACSFTPGRSLRSQDKHSFLEPAVSTIIGSRGFSYAAPSIWNKLRLGIRNSSSFASFKRNLNTYYFSCAFS